MGWRRGVRPSEFLPSVGKAKFKGSAWASCCGYRGLKSLVFETEGCHMSKLTITELRELVNGGGVAIRMRQRLQPAGAGSANSSSALLGL
jgi:hypothetical protein